MPVIGWKCGQESDPDDHRGETEAKSALQVLCRYYPGYSWVTEVHGGVLIIRNYSLDWRGRWCMVLHMNDIQHDAHRFQRDVRWAAGEFLERARQKRGPMVPGQESNPVLEGAPTLGAKAWTPDPKTPIFVEEKE